mgnify:CR=1 FL=1
MSDKLERLPGVGRVVAAIRSSYRRKLAAAIVVVLVITSVAMLGLYVQVGVLLGENVEQSMTATASTQAGEITEWSSRNRLVTRVLSEHSVFASGDQTAIRDYLQTQRAMRTETIIESAYVIDRRNRTVETSAPRSLEGTHTDELPIELPLAFQHFDTVRTTRPRKTADGGTIVGLTTPIRQYPGHLLVLVIDADDLGSQFDHPVAGGFTRVVNSNGTVVLADDPSATLRQYQDGPLRAPAVSMGLRGESGFVEQSRYEQSTGTTGDYVAAFAPVEGTDWVVIEHAPTSSAYAITREVRTWIGIIGVVTLGGLVGVVVVLGADVTGSLASLSRRAGRIAGGEYDVSFDTDRRDEFGDLNRTLATMQDTLQQRFEELRETKRDLEASNRALEERSTMVSVLNRIFRHNVANDVNTITGRAEILEEQIEDEGLRAQLDVITETAWGLAAISDRAKRFRTLLSEENATTIQVDLEECLSATLDEIRARAPASTVTLTVSDDPVVAQCISMLPLAFGDIVDRLISHNGGTTTVDIAVTRTSEADGASVVITVDDDGHGLPALDVEAIEDGQETQLSHAEGLALWSLKWAVDKSGGELAVHTAETTLTIRLPAASPTESQSAGTESDEAR